MSILKNLIKKPFKGSCGYELQIGKFVFILKYPHSNQEPERERWEMVCFHDPYWNS